MRVKGKQSNSESAGKMPCEWTSQKTQLKLLFRIATPEDDRLLRDFYRSLSRETVFTRWGEALPAGRSLDDALIKQFLAPNPHRVRMIALVDGGQKLAAIGEYFTRGEDVEPGYPEVGVVVGDGYQHQGVGLESVKQLARHAKENRFTGFIINTHVDNKPALEFLTHTQELGLEVEARTQVGTDYKFKLRFV